MELAQKYAASGAYERAILELQKIVQVDPSDTRTWLRMAELYAKLNRRSQAIDAYFRVAQHFAEQGFFQKAIAVLQQLLAMEPKHFDARLRLAEMYEAMQLVRDAQNEYEGLLVQCGEDFNCSLEILRRLAQLNPDDLRNRLRYAEALSAVWERTKDDTFREKAADEFLEIAKRLKELGHISQFITVLERYLFHRPSDFEMTKELVARYIEEGQGIKAISRAQFLYQEAPENPEVLRLLARAFVLVGRRNEARDILREVVEIYRSYGDAVGERETLKEILALDPSDRGSFLALQALEMKGASAASVPLPSPGDGEEEGVMFTETTSSFLLGATNSSFEQGEAGLSDEDEEAWNTQTISENLDPQIRAQLEALVGRGENQADEWVNRVTQVEAKKGLVPEDEIPIDLDESAGGESEQEEAHAFSGASAKKAAALKMREARAFMQYGLLDLASEELKAAIALDPENIEAREWLKDLWRELGKIDDALKELFELADFCAQSDPARALRYLEEAKQLSPHHPELARRLAFLRGDLQEPKAFPSAGQARQMSDEMGNEKQAREVPKASVPVGGARHETGKPQISSVQPSSHEKGGKAELRLPLHPPPKRPLPPLPPPQAKHSLPHKPLVPPPAPPAQRIASALSEGKGGLAQPQFAPTSPKMGEGVLQVFAEGSNVIEIDELLNTIELPEPKNESLDKEEAEGQYQLGIAYKEMGLIAKAISAFEKSALFPGMECESYKMIGLCKMDAKDYAGAIHALKRALHAQEKTLDQEVGVFYHLGRVYEEIAEKDEAIYYYERAIRRIPNYLDVGERLEKLKSKS
ncbi:MAG: tetratricopeptide repeat protein [Sandaracinaceae bacterium]|nr:tetratricopeptide repeat protein [Sandaracinaceae bacterium]